MKVMCNPVILSSGHAVELDALLAFWRTCPFAIVNPVTHEKLAGLEDVALVPALQVRSAVDAYLSTLPPGTAPDGWENANIGHRSTREELRVLSCRVHQVSTCATTVRLGGSLPRAANEQARACLGVYERDAKLTNDKPSYTKRGGSHALWFSSVKPDGSRNCFWHAAEVQFKGSAAGHLGAHAPDNDVVEPPRRRGVWQAASAAPTPSDGDENDDDDSDNEVSPTVGARAGGVSWVVAPDVYCGSASDEGEQAALMASSASAVVVSGTLPAILNAALHAEYYRTSLLGLFDRDVTLTNGRASYTRRGGSTFLWISPDHGHWHLGGREQHGSGRSSLHALATADAVVAELITGPWTVRAPAPVQRPEGTVEHALNAPTYIEVPLWVDAASVELVGSLPDAMIGKADQHGAAAYFGLYDLLVDRGHVNGRPAYVQRGSRCARALWFVPHSAQLGFHLGFWHFGLMEQLGQACGPICAQEVAEGVNREGVATARAGPAWLSDPASWQVNDGERWHKALVLRCRAV
eukprot:jgi/Chrpa1/16808/Chrysochromulina_OHIO_Genome00003849-RA